MVKGEKHFKKVCKCQHCGNEAEMLVTCTLEHSHEEAHSETAPEANSDKKRVKGKGICTSCGNEADMWIDI